MSAGGLSYSALNTKPKVSLPSVESWGTNMNIMKDPPKSIHTRRIDKVGENSDITKMVGEDSGDRACEAIRVYPRGINPAVGVSMDNYGMNGGQNPLSSALSVYGGQSYYPHRIMRDGVFRPPVLSQRELLPLSRLPRTQFSAVTNPSFISYAKRQANVDRCKAIRPEMLTTCVKPNAVYNINVPIQEKKHFSEIIDPLYAGPVSSGIRGGDKTYLTVKTPEGHIDQNYVTVPYATNLSNPYVKDGESNHNVQLARDLPFYSARTNKSQNIQVGILQNTIKPYEKNVPVHSARTAVTSNSVDRTFQNNEGRNYNRLAPRLSMGGTQDISIRPTTDRIQSGQIKNTGKRYQLLKRAAMQQHG
jgi:hypothetical protein